MNLGLVVSDVAAEEPRFTTTRLARAALRRGHEVWYLGVGDFVYDADEHLRARASRTEVPSEQLGDDASLQAVLASANLADAQERVDVADLDVLWLRNDPAPEVFVRPWAHSAAVVFGELAAERDVLVVNDPAGLAKALNKLYLQHFPPEIRPDALITRDPEDVWQFLDEHTGRAVIKPLQGSGGEAVFLVGAGDEANRNQMFETVSRLGYVVVQEYLPEAAEGDIRLLMVNGEAPRHHDAVAAFRRSQPSLDVRNNTARGADRLPVERTEEILAVADMAAPQLIEDGIFFAGLDIAGGRILEVNVFSPAGIGSIESVTGVDFAPRVIEALEHKVERQQASAGPIPNRQLATLNR